MITVARTATNGQLEVAAGMGGRSPSALYATSVTVKIRRPSRAEAATDSGDETPLAVWSAWQSDRNLLQKFPSALVSAGGLPPGWQPEPERVIDDLAGAHGQHAPQPLIALKAGLAT